MWAAVSRWKYIYSQLNAIQMLPHDPRRFSGGKSSLQIHQIWSHDRNRHSSAKFAPLRLSCSHDRNRFERGIFSPFSLPSTRFTKAKFSPCTTTTVVTRLMWAKQRECFPQCNSDAATLSRSTDCRKILLSTIQLHSHDQNRLNSAKFFTLAIYKDRKGVWEESRVNFKLITKPTFVWLWCGCWFKFSLK